MRHRACPGRGRRRRSAVHDPGHRLGHQSLLDGRARENVERRWVELFEDLHGQLEALRDRIPNPKYYGSEEFQTLLALAWEQLLTTHDRANSGTAEFQNDDKEPYVRTLREFSLPDLLFLRTLLPNPVHYDNPADDRHDEEIATFSRLLGTGLVKDRSIPGLDGANRRIYQLTRFGRRFLAFLETESSA